ncbi:MAG: branched-chain amino acid transport system substrate-binding protein [Gaiellaceae bacterium]|jgi:ABC-type branched-subunit amino acid transport system substrate-binding protein|nr:branched-chain amino acid transport system substrate-binding protein [Gaiellaceae bacterium]
MKRTFLLLAAALLASAAVVMTAGASSQATPGVTAKSILLEGTFPLSGPASGYAPIPTGMKAYFDYVNSKGGVNGRKIDWRFDDDGYNPANTLQLTHKYVEQDHAFALVGGLGTEPQTAVRQYLNDNKVPQLFVSTGATTFDRDWSLYPWTLGWQPDYEAEGAIYGKYVAKNFPSAKLGVLYQNDDYGNDYLRGLKAGLTQQHQPQIVLAAPYDLSASPPAAQVAALKASGADTFVIFATPTPTIQAYVVATKLGWTPAHVITNSVSATDTFLTIASKSGSAITNGTLTVSYLLDPSNPIYNKQPGMKLYRTIMAKFAPKSNANDGLNLYGVAKAWTTVQVLQAAGKSLTRAGLMKAARNMAFTTKLKKANPFALPGVDVRTKGAYQYPISQVNLVQYSNNVFQPVGKLINGRGA